MHRQITTEMKDKPSNPPIGTSPWRGWAIGHHDAFRTYLALTQHQSDGYRPYGSTGSHDKSAINQVIRQSKLILWLCFPSPNRRRGADHGYASGQNICLYDILLVSKVLPEVTYPSAMWCRESVIEEFACKPSKSSIISTCPYSAAIWRGVRLPDRWLSTHSGCDVKNSSAPS